MKRIYLICLLLLGFSSWSIAQTRTVKGRVTDAASGDALPLVSVQVKGTTSGTQTDTHGNFTLQLPDGKRTELLFSYIGYAPLTMVADDVNMTVKMESNNKKLDEIVVVGYGMVKKTRSHRCGGIRKRRGAEKSTFYQRDGSSTGQTTRCGYHP